MVVPYRGLAAVLAPLLASVTLMSNDRTSVAAERSTELRVIELKEPDGQILSYRHLAGSTVVHLKGTALAPDAQIRVKIGSRPGFVELDINHGGISGLKPAHLLGRDFLTYVLWAVSIDGKAANLGELTFEGDHAVAVNVTTTYQTFWLMVTAEPSYAVVDPSPSVVLYSVKQDAAAEDKALPIAGERFYFTHYSSYESTSTDLPAGVPNELLQARKAMDLASKSSALAIRVNAGFKEEEYTRLALAQATTFLAQAEDAYKKNPKDQQVVQFARTAAQNAEDARALATGAVGGMAVRQLEQDNAKLRDEIARLKSDKPADSPPAGGGPLAEPTPTDTPAATPMPPPDPVAPTPLVKQPALWFAVAGWVLALVLLFRRRSI